MPIASKYAGFHTAIVGGYTNPANAYSDNASYATAAPAKNNEISAYFGFAGFTTAELPADATILRVTVSLAYFVSATNSIPTQGIQVFRGTTGIDSEQTNTTSPTTDTLLAHEVLSGISLADLRSNDFVRAMVRSHRGNTNNAVTFNVRYVQVTVEFKTPEDYTVQLSDTVSVSDGTIRSRGVFATLTDAVTASDNTLREKIIEKLLSDSVSASDGNARQSSYGRIIPDTVTASDNRTDLKTFQIEVADSVTPSDTRTAQKSVSKSIADSVSVSDIPVIFSSNSMSGKIALLARRIAQEVKSLWNALGGKADAGHNHDAAYLGINAKAADSDKLDGKDSTEFALSGHNHSGIYEPVIIKSPGYLRYTGSVWEFKNEIYSLTSHNHSGIYEPVFPKNTAFNKNFGTSAGTVTEGNDTRLNNARTPADASVTYGKLATDLTSRNTVAAANIDWNSGGVFVKILTGNTTFTFSDLKLNKVIVLVLIGDFAITLPVYCKRISGTYNGLVNNYIQFHCTHSVSGMEEVWYLINQEET